jgi:hypothetical protein
MMNGLSFHIQNLFKTQINFKSLINYDTKSKNLAALEFSF